MFLSPARPSRDSRATAERAHLRHDSREWRATSSEFGAGGPHGTLGDQPPGNNRAKQAGDRDGRCGQHQGASRRAPGASGPRRGASRPGAALAAAGLAAAALAIAQAGPGITALRPVRLALFPRLSGVGTADHVALTFDDGPDPAATPRFIDDAGGPAAAGHLLHAGLDGGPVAALAAEVAAAGHEVGVHG